MSDTLTRFENAAEIAAEILSIVAEGEFEHYGIRALTITSTGDNGLPAPALRTVLGNSRVWDDGDVTDEELDGVCALGLDLYDADDADYELPRIERSLRALDSMYTGRYIVLLGSDRAMTGEDAGELVMRDAPVLAVWDRGEKTFRSLR